VTTIGEVAFYKNQITSVSIPDSVTSIVEGAFYENRITSVSVPEGASIEEGAFDKGTTITRR
jgi:hypothetical protein